MIANTQQKRTKQEYYQYESLKEVKHKFMKGRVLSGFTCQALGNKVMIAYGSKRHSNKISPGGIDRLGEGDGKMLMDFAYTMDWILQMLP